MQETENDILKRVRKIEIKTRGLSNEIFAGKYHTAFRGRGMSFSEVREYRAGDDVRDIDWNVTARSRTPHIKVYEEERELTMMLLVDVSGSRMFGTMDRLKKNLQTEIAAVLAFSASETGSRNSSPRKRGAAISWPSSANWSASSRNRGERASRKRCVS